MENTSFTPRNPTEIRELNWGFRPVRLTEDRARDGESWGKSASPTRRFASERRELSPNGSQSGYSARVGVKGSPIPGLRRQRQGRQSHLLSCGSPSTGPPLCDTSRSVSVRALRVTPLVRDAGLVGIATLATWRSQSPLIEASRGGVLGGCITEKSLGPVFS
jgi:hypothetical protein